MVASLLLASILSAAMAPPSRVLVVLLFAAASAAAAHARWPGSAAPVPPSLAVLLAATVPIPGALGATHLRFNDVTGELERLPVPPEKLRPSKHPLHWPTAVAPSDDEYFQPTEQQRAVSYVHTLQHSGPDGMGNADSYCLQRLSVPIRTKTLVGDSAIKAYDSPYYGRVFTPSDPQASSFAAVGGYNPSPSPPAVHMPLRDAPSPPGGPGGPLGGPSARPSVPEPALAALFDRYGGVDAALELLSRAVAVDPNDPVMWSDLGNAHRVKGDSARAIDCFEKALRIQRHPDFFLNLGGVRFLLGELEEALRLFNLGLQMKPDHTLLLFSLGNAQAARGNKEEAVKAFEHVLRLQPDFTAADQYLRSIRRELRRSIWPIGAGASGGSAAAAAGAAAIAGGEAGAEVRPGAGPVSWWASCLALGLLAAGAAHLARKGFSPQQPRWRAWGLGAAPPPAAAAAAAAAGAAAGKGGEGWRRKGGR